MDNSVRQRIAWALKCKPEDVPEDAQDIKQALEKRRHDLKKAKEAKHG